MSDVEAIHVEWELLDPEGDAESCLPPLHIGLLSTADALASQMSGAAHLTPAWAAPDLDEPLKRAEEQLPSVGSSNQTAAATQAASESREAPVGTRRKWHNRIVEKLKDGSWHVVGHVAGLEDPKRVEPVRPGELGREELIQLITRVLHHMYEQGEHRAEGRDEQQADGHGAPKQETRGAPEGGAAKDKAAKSARKGEAMKAEDAFKAAADMLQRASEVLKAAVKNVPEESSDDEVKERDLDKAKAGCGPDEIGKGSVPAPVLGQLAPQSAGGSMVPGVDAPKPGEFAAAGYSVAGIGLDPGVDAPLPPEIGLGMDGGSVYIPDGMTW